MHDPRCVAVKTEHEIMREKIDALSPQELEMAFRKQLREYHVEDAKSHVEYDFEDDERASSLNEKDYGRIVDRYEDKHDCELSDNDNWRGAIEWYLDNYK